MTWLHVVGLKLLIAPLFALAYWLVAIKGGNALARFLIPSAKWREILTKDRYF